MCTDITINKPIAIQGTNDYSMVSKYSTSNIGYYSDPFLKHFVSKPARRAPIIHWGYYIRYRAVQNVLSSFSRWGRGCGASKRQVVVLGAGFDTAFLRLRDEGLTEGVIYVEVDFPLVIENKKRMVAASGIETGNWHMLGQDLRDTKSLLSQLRTIPGIDQFAPTLFISEVVLTYMRPSHSSRLLRWAALNFPHLAFLVYEQVYTRDPFGLVMMQHYRTIGSPLHTAAEFETPREQESRFLRLGYQHARSVDMNTVFYSYTADVDAELSRLLSLEQFDEFEEWHQKCNHYTVLLAGRGAGTDFIASLPPPFSPISPPLPLISPSPKLRILPSSPITSRHSHASCFNSVTESVFLVGGWGGEGGAHGRLGSIGEVNLAIEEDKVECVCTRSEVRGNPPDGILHPTLSSLPDGSMVLVGGRKSPRKPNIHTYFISPQWSEGERRCVWRVLPLTPTSPQPRWRHSATVVSSEGEGVALLIHGGLSSEGVVLGDTWALEVDKHRWTRISTEIEDSLAVLHSHSAVVWKDRLLVYGGLSRNLMPSAHLQMLSYKETTPKWEQIPFDPHLPARYSHCSVLLGSTLYSVGGVQLHTPCYCSLLTIDLANHSWGYTDLSHSLSPLTNFLPYNFTANLVHKKYLLVLGGGGNCFSFGTHINSHPWVIQLPPVAD